MADPMDVERLERRLGELAREIEWPATPDLRARVRRRIERRFQGGLTVLLVAAAVALALGTQVAVAEYLQLRGATVQSVPALPSPSAVPGADLGHRSDLGDRFDSVGAAAKVAGFAPLVPAALGRPDEVYGRQDVGVVTLVYRPRPGLPATVDPQVGALVIEARGQVSRPSFGKLVQPGVSLEEVAVGGDRGYWVSGAPHGFFIYQAGGDGYSTDTLRLSGDALLWNRGALVIHLESGLGKERSIALAQSLG
jgi:hypothetical protein